MVTADQAKAIVYDAMLLIYNSRPLVQWTAYGGDHRCSEQFAIDILELMPVFKAQFPGVLEATQIVGKRPAFAHSLSAWLARPCSISHDWVSYACWITTEFCPSTVHLVVFALARCRGICSDRVMIWLSICVVAVA